MADEALGRDIASLLGDLQETGFSSASLQVGASRLYLRRPMAAPATSPAAAQPSSQESDEAERRRTLRSTRVGYFSPRQGTNPGERFRKGDPIAAGEVYGVIEANNNKYELRAEMTGRVDQFLAAEGEAVEYGQPLLALAEE